MERTCASCAQPFDGATSRAKYCSTACRKRAFRDRGAGLTELRVVEPRPDTAGLVETATRAELDAAGRTATSLGAKAVALAVRIDAGRDTGAALAALVRQHDATMAEAMRGVSTRTSIVDELRRRRDAKLGAG